MSVHDVIKRREVALTVTRPTQESVQFGYATRESSAVAGVLGHMQPLSDRELRFVPEGMNTLEWWNIWSETELLESDQVTDGTAPTVTVVKHKFWKEGIFYHVQGTRVDDATALTAIINGIGAGVMSLPVGAGVGAHP